MPDLHTALEAAITTRLEVARAATPNSEPIIRSAAAMSGFNVLNVLPFAEIHDPADAVRRYERDLRVLKRHAELPNSWGSCSHCRTSWTDRNHDVVLGDWPCPEITDLLDVYPEVTR